MKLRATGTMLAMMAMVAALSAFWVGLAKAGVSVSFSYSSRPADIRVWLGTEDYEDHYYDSDYDVYPSADDVVLYVRASRSCFATVYVVDTAGYIHVIHPFSPDDDTYLRGGRVYRFYLSDYGLAQGFDRGIAYAYAVSSPVRFAYAYYGAGVFGPNFGFQVYGDPFIASRHFYLSLLPRSCDLRLIGVSYTRFYVREYVRYPSYLCVGWHNYYGVRTYCRSGCSVYRSYTTHARDPYHVLHPTRRLRTRVSGLGEVTRNAKWKGDDRTPARQFRPRRSSRPEVFDARAVDRDKRTVKRVADARPVTQKKVTKKTRTTRQTRVVKSSKQSFVRSKKDISAMRQQLKRSSEKKSMRSHQKVTRASNKQTRKSVQHVAKKNGGRRDAKVRKVSEKTQNTQARKTSKHSKKSRSDESRKAKHGKR